MTDTHAAPFVDSIFHLTDFGQESEYAFAHALAIALVRQGNLTVFHAGKKHLAGNEWHRFPAVRDTLENWGVLANGSSPEDIRKSTGVRIEKVDLTSANVEKAAKDYLAYHPTDLLVLSTKESTGMLESLTGTVAEHLETQTHIKTLFVPEKVKPFVSLKTGEVHLKKILVALDVHPDPSAIVEYCARVVHFAKNLGDEVTVILMHNGADFTFANHVERLQEATDVQTLITSGSPSEQILSVAKSEDVDLIMMATRSQKNFLQALQGSVTHKVLHESPCPLLAVPSE